MGIGNAIVDILCPVDPDFLEIHGVNHGIMQLVDLERAAYLYGRMSSTNEVSGGSVANTVAGIVALGGSSAFIGKVKDDHLGRVFRDDLRAQGAEFTTPTAPRDAAFETGRSMILVTPDGERSMNTYLGASEILEVSDMDEDLIAASKWIYLEGYRFDGPECQEAFRVATKRCHDSGGKVSLTLSDPYCVRRHRGSFRGLIRKGLDLLLCNRQELRVLYETENLDIALAEAAKEIDIVACTLSEDGAVVAQQDRRFHVPAVPTRIVDATGAGDLFAAGFLFGLTSGRDLMTAGRMGCLAASEVIGHLGARPESDILSVFRERNLVD